MIFSSFTASGSALSRSEGKDWTKAERGWCQEQKTHSVAGVQGKESKEETGEEGS